jgi:hypothetical protein
MSFKAFMEWIRNFFSSHSGPDTGTGNSTVDTTPSDTSNTTTPNTPTAPPEAQPSPPPIPEPAPTPPPTPEVPEPTPTPPPIPEVPEPVPTPPPLPVTPDPAPVPPQIPAPPENRLAFIQSVTTADNKVALNQTIVFQIVTDPPEQYEDCTLDLSGADDASIEDRINPITGRFSLSFDKASSSDNDIQLIKVSNPQGDAEIAVTVSLMKLFWHNHPGRKNVCDETLFVNQCAIRMGAALELSGIVMTQDRRVLRRCTTEYRAFKHHKDGLVKGHVLAAQELANWIKSETSTFGRRSVVHSQEEILGRTGVIFFRDGWGATDHIDVWDGEALVGGFPSYFDADFKELWFWDVY